MMHHEEPREHPTDRSLVAWVDARIGAEAPDEATAGTGVHLDECVECQARARELEQIVAALGAEPAMPAPAELAARRARVMEAIAARRSEPVTPLRRRAAWWAPALAAAAVVALLLARGVVGPGTNGPGDAGPPAPGMPLPVAAAGEEAALEVVQALQAAEIENGGGPTRVEISTDPDAFATTVLVDPVAPATWLTFVEDAALLDEFASLPIDDQEAILSELAAWRLEL